jgi:putative FmdB family regulatory protein
VPLYEYECDACGRRFEVIQKFSDAPVEVCKECGKGPVRRLPSSPAIQFKGSGWYVTDYAKKGTSDATTPAAKTDGAKSDTGSDSTAAKTDTPKSEAPKTDSGASGSKSKE